MAAGKKILIVEDDEDCSAFLSTVLEEHDYEIMVAANGEEGLVKAVETPPDLILLDLIMPRRSGMKFLNEVKSDDRLCGIPIVIVSGAGKATGIDMKHNFEIRPLGGRKQEAPIEDVNLEPHAFLEKPVQAKDLIVLVESILAQ